MNNLIESRSLSQDKWLAVRWQRKAQRAYAIREYSDTVIALNIWLETMLVRLTVRLNHDNDTPMSDVSAEVRRKKLSKFVNAHLGSKFLKGNWDSRSANTPFGLWVANCRSVRDRIVHEGYEATENEVNLAMEASFALEQFIITQGEQSSVRKVRESVRAFFLGR